MAKKKRKPERRKPKRGSRSKPGADLPKLPDRRAMEKVLHQLVSQQQASHQEDTPLARAQELMYQAFEERDETRRIQLARKALEISPDCADAYVLLAEHAASRKEALELYEKGVQAGERTLGREGFQQAVGHFWGILETRPYMRARLGLALSLWTAARREEAVEHLQDMLRLNPNDNQGVRYTLAGFLLNLDRDEDLGKLLEQYPEEGFASWPYTHALLAFRQQGDGPEARRWLAKALKANKHVPAYLLGQKFPTSQQPSYISPGADSEAIDYVGSFLAPWKATPGAIAWLRDNVTSAKKKKPTAPQPKGPLALIKKWLHERLPQEADTWQADFRQMPSLIEVAGEPVHPWIVMVASRSNDLVLAHGILPQAPSDKHLWDELVQAMQNPMAGEPHRPSELQVRADPRWEALKQHFEEIGVGLVVTDELDQMNFLFQDLSEHLGGEPEPGLLDMPGIGPEQVGSFYEAAAQFFQQAPWKKVFYESAIKVECDKFTSGPWYAVLMGQAGLTMGLTLYEDLNLLRRLWEGDLSDEDNARLTVATTVLFGNETDIPFADLEAARRHGWKVARPDAYPSIFRKERGMSMRPPLAWEIELMEGCLRAIPGFVARRHQEDATAEDVTVPAASAELRLRLSWVVEEGA